LGVKFSSSILTKFRRYSLFSHLVSRVATPSPSLPPLSHLFALDDPVDGYRRFLDPKVSSALPLPLSLPLPPLSPFPACVPILFPLSPRPCARPGGAAHPSTALWRGSPWHSPMARPPAARPGVPSRHGLAAQPRGVAPWRGPLAWPPGGSPGATSCTAPRCDLLAPLRRAPWPWCAAGVACAAPRRSPARPRRCLNFSFSSFKI
jgi:hypothetical protein